jgi:putative lumazine-binding protein
METMRRLTTFLLFALAPLFAQTSDEADTLAAVQKTFDGMAAHDAATIRSSMLPDARLYAIREEGAPAAGTAAADFANQIASSKDGILERFTSRPRVSIRGRMAQVWGEYEFRRNGTFHHCGVDSFSLFKTAEGWKIVTIVYTVETTSCKGQ